MTSQRISVAVLGLLLVAPAIALIEQPERKNAAKWIEPAPARVQSEKLDLDSPSAATERARRFLERHGGEWTFRTDPRSGNLNIASGSGIPLIPGRGNALDRDALAGLDLPDGEITVAGIEPLAREFIRRNFNLEPIRGTLVLDENASQLRAGGRLISFLYRWHVDGVPVEGAAVFVRVNSGNIIQFGSRLVAPIDLATAPVVEAREARRILLTHTGDHEVARAVGEPQLLIQPLEARDGSIAYRLAWKFQYTILAEIELWEGVVDAHSGQLVSFRDAAMYATTVGGVYPRTVFGEDEVLAPMMDMNVVVNGDTVMSDLAAHYPYTGGDASSGINGPFWNTDCNGCSNPDQPFVSADIGIARLDFGFGGVDTQGNGFSTPADRNTHYHLSYIRRIAKKWLPNLGWLDFPNFDINTNVNATCNAQYFGTGMNFFRSGGGCNNSGEISDVMHHEWGHGIDANTLAGDGGTGEGTGDVLALQLSHSSLVGPGFRTNGDPVRDINYLTSDTGLLTLSNIGQCGGEVHCVGEIYGQSAWDLSQILVGNYGHHTGWRVSERLFFLSLPDSGDWNPNDSNNIYDAYIMADDDDGNLANGTPNAIAIYDAFRVHEIDNGPSPESVGCSMPHQPLLNVTSDCDRFEVSWSPVQGLIDHYELFRTELREDTAFLSIATIPAGQTSYTDSEVIPGVDYWYTVMAVTVNDCESAIENPFYSRLQAQPILSVSGVVTDDTPRGNRSGFPDPGEEVDLTLSLVNLGEVDGTSISGQISSTTPGVTVLEDSSTFSSLISGGGDGQSLDTLRIQTDDQLVSCGDLIRLQFEADDASGCTSETSYFDVQIGEPDGQGGYECDLTPACFVEPTFDGIQQADPGNSCAETLLAWNPAQSNCTNAVISYNVYRSQAPGFTPDAGNLVAVDISSSGYTDVLLQPGIEYHYIVRANDSRSGEDSNTVEDSAIATSEPDIVGPTFAGIESASESGSCGQIALSWQPGLEACNAPVTYDIYRSTDPGFTPGAANLIGSSLSTDFVDAALVPDEEYTYIVRARDELGNQESNEARATILASAIDLAVFDTQFEPNNAGWAVGAPNTATDGIWAWGDPQQTSYQSGNDNTPPPGVNCWITGLGAGSDNDDVDGGTTTLVSELYDMASAVKPVVRYARYFTNDQGASPGDSTDTFKIDVSNDDGQSWTRIEEIGAGTPLAWIEVEVSLDGVIAPTNEMRFRFQASDLGAGSLVEAGIDDFELLDRDQGCIGCDVSVNLVGTIFVDKSGDDIVIDWTDDPAVGTTFNVYQLSGPSFAVAIKVGSTEGRSFVHADAALTSGDFYYRVTAIDSCGGESDLD